MVQLVNNENSYRIIMDKNTNVKVRDVYNRIFFSAIGLDGIRIYGKDPMPDIKDDVIELSESESEAESESESESKSKSESEFNSESVSNMGEYLIFFIIFLYNLLINN